MTPLVVDPVVLSAAGAAVVAAGDGLAANLTVLVGGFAANTGHDHGGTALGLGYQCAGQSLVSAAAAVVNACRFNGAKIELSGALSASTALVGGQQIPEGAQIGEVLSQIGDHASSVGAQCGKLAATLDRFAEEVSYAQKAIRDLLHRLGSLGDIAHDIALVLEGKAFDEVERIAADINAVLHCLGREAPAWEQSLDGGVQAVDGLVVGMERFMGGQFTHFLGQQVGNQVAATFDTWVNTGEGFLKGAYEMARGIEGVDPWWFVLDPQGAAATWKTMTKTGLLNHVLNPQDAVDADKQMVGSLLHLDDWRADRPGLGLGENLFDVATLVVPGVGEAGAGAKGAAAAGRAAEEGGQAAGVAGRGAGAAGAGGALGDIGKAGAGLTKDLDGLTGDLAKPESPRGAQPVGRPTDTLAPAPVKHAPHPDDPAPAGGAHEPAPAPPDGLREPASAPTLHEPGSTPTDTPHEPSSSPPAKGPHDPVPAVAGGARESSWADVPAAEQVPQFPGGSPAAPASDAAHPPAPADASPAPRTSDFAPASGRPAELPTPRVGGPGTPGDGVSAGQHQGKPPHGLICVDMVMAVRQTATRVSRTCTMEHLRGQGPGKVTSHEVRINLRA